MYLDRVSHSCYCDLCFTALPCERCAKVSLSVNLSPTIPGPHTWPVRAWASEPAPLWGSCPRVYRNAAGHEQEAMGSSFSDGSVPQRGRLPAHVPIPTGESVDAAGLTHVAWRSHLTLKSEPCGCVQPCWTYTPLPLSPILGAFDNHSFLIWLNV